MNKLRTLALEHIAAREYKTESGKRIGHNSYIAGFRKARELISQSVLTCKCKRCITNILGIGEEEIPNEQTKHLPTLPDKINGVS